MENYKRVGRKKGQKATKDKFLIECKNIKENRWEEFGRYPSLRSASKEMGLPYAILSDINIGRRKVYTNFYRIKTLRKHKEENLDKLDEIEPIIQEVTSYYHNDAIKNLLAESDNDDDSEISQDNFI